MKTNNVTKKQENGQNTALLAHHPNNDFSAPTWPNLLIQSKGSHVVCFRWPISRLETTCLTNKTPRSEKTPCSLDMVHLRLLCHKTLHHMTSAYYAADARERLHAREKHRQRQVAAWGNIWKPVTHLAPSRHSPNKRRCSVWDSFLLLVDLVLVLEKVH